MSLCPTTSWVMCGGIPFMTASVMKSLRRSCGRKMRGCPLASVIPEWLSASLSMSQFTGGWQGVLDEAVMAEFFQLLDSQAGRAKDCHRGPGPKPAVLFEGEVSTLPRFQVVGPDPGACVPGGDRPAQSLACGSEFLTGRNVLGGSQSFSGLAPLSVHGGDEHGQDRHALASPLIHPGLTVLAFLGVGDFVQADRAGHRPRSPPGRVLGGPVRDVQVEGPHHGEAVQRGSAWRTCDTGFRRACEPVWLRRRKGV
jgi:hypothetical protein